MNIQIMDIEIESNQSEFEVYEALLESYTKEYNMQFIYQEAIGNERKSYRKDGESVIATIFKFIGRLINNIIYRIRKNIKRKKLKIK